MNEKQRGFTLLEMLFVMALFACSLTITFYFIDNGSHCRHTVRTLQNFLQGVIDYALANEIKSASLLIGCENENSLREFFLLLDNDIISEWHYVLPKDAEIVQQCESSHTSLIDDKNMTTLPELPGHWCVIAMDRFVAKSSSQARIILRIGRSKLYEFSISDNWTVSYETR
jgi:prepilin-type N-terminal cleavage/methylation domain-containing protein